MSITLVSGSTYSINGLSTLTAAEGSYTLTVHAASILDSDGRRGGRRDVDLVVDGHHAPHQHREFAAAQTTSTSFAISATAADPDGADGSTPSGVASIAIYDSINGGSFTLFTTVGPAEPSATFTGLVGETYAFYSIATDEAGNVQPAPAAAQQTIKIVSTMTVNSIRAVTPDPRNTSISSLEVAFSLPINTSSLTQGTLGLTDNGQSISTTGASLALVSGDTYQINGLAAATVPEGTYVLTVNAADIKDTSGNPGTGSVSTSWLMDTTSPTSAVNSLPAQTTSTTFTVSVAATDPAGVDGSTPAGVAAIAIFDAINGGSFTLLTIVTPSNPTATFTGQAGNTCAFYSVATDRADNVQSTPTACEADCRNSGPDDRGLDRRRRARPSEYARFVARRHFQHANQHEQPDTSALRA